MKKFKIIFLFLMAVGLIILSTGETISAQDYAGWYCKSEFSKGELYTPKNSYCFYISSYDGEKFNGYWRKEGVADLTWEVFHKTASGTFETYPPPNWNKQPHFFGYRLTFITMDKVVFENFAWEDGRLLEKIIYTR